MPEPTAEGFQVPFAPSAMPAALVPASSGVAQAASLQISNAIWPGEPGLVSSYVAVNVGVAPSSAALAGVTSGAATGSTLSTPKSGLPPMLVQPEARPPWSTWQARQW